MGECVVHLDKFRIKKKKLPIVTPQDETEIYVSELKDEFNELLNLEQKGGEKNERIRKNDRKRT
jgi:hypothetical protein